MTTTTKKHANNNNSDNNNNNTKHNNHRTKNITTTTRLCVNVASMDNFPQGHQSIRQFSRKVEESFAYLRLPRATRQQQQQQQQQHADNKHNGNIILGGDGETRQ